MRNRSIPIAVDAMGGDHAPQREVEGAVLAARQHGVRILLVGQEELLRRQLSRHAAEDLPLDVIPASEVITMGENVARSVRQKRNSSIRVAIRLVREGRAQGVVSAGNTGAVMATAKIVLGTLPNVDRPALAAILPPLRGHPTILIDVGANVDCKPEQLRQFAIMGEVYSRLLFRLRRPRVGLLSIGSEQIKGNELTREAHRLLQQSALNFIGNVEGRDLYQGRVDVIVCDGFTGNVALKISEGLAETLRELLQETLSAATPAPVASLPVQQALADFSKYIDYAETGGAVLLGVKGVCLICHGSSTPHAIQNAIRKAAEYASAGITEKIEQEMHRLDAGLGAPRPQTAASN